MTLTQTAGTQTAGSTLSYLVTATDALGNTQTKAIRNVRIYGAPSITFDTEKTAMNVSDTVNAALLSATAKDSHGGDLAVSVSVASGSVAGGSRVTFRLSATDALGNTAAVVTQEIKVYSTDVIALSYNGAASTRIKKSSRGEEFGAAATTVFGDECALSLEAAEGSVLAGGNTVGLYIVATDPLGNTVKSDLISGIRVYDTPTLTYAREYPYIQNGDSPYALFSLTDSFGGDVLFTVTTVSGSLDVNETVVYRITGTDRTGNPFDETRELVVLAADESILELYDNGVLVGTQRVTRGAAYTLPAEHAPWTYDAVALTDEVGNSLTIWDKKPNGYRLDSRLFSVSFDAAGGEYPTESLIFDVWEYYPLSEPIRPGYAFVGWYTEFDEKVTNLQGHYTDLTLTARWELLLLIDGSGAITGTTDYFKQQTEEYEIPVAVEGTLITSIAANAFADSTDLTSVTIPDCITSIGNDAFYNCTRLTSVTIGNGVTSIGDYAFSGCSGLTSVTIGDGVTTIGSEAFYNCSGLTEIIIPNSVTSIGADAFRGCSSLQSITIPFVGGSRKTARDTYQYPFGYIFGTSSYTGGVATTQNYYGSSTSSPTNATYYIPSSLKSVTVTGGEILYGAFYNCSGLTSVTIDNDVASIQESSFFGCSSLQSISIPFVGRQKQADYGNRFTFGYIFGRSSYDGSTATKQKILNSLNISDTEIIYYIPSSLKSVTVTGDIIYYAFYNCFMLTSVTIGNNVTSIGGQAFEGCTGLTSVSIPDSVTTIGWGAFRNCSRLSRVTIGNGVTSILRAAFYGCTGLTSVTFQNPSGWYVTKTPDASSGTNVTVTNASLNATYLTNNYNDYWYRK